MSFLPTLFNRENLFPNLMQELELLQTGMSSQGLNIYEEKDSIVVQADMPGLNPEEIKVDMRNGIIRIKAEKKETETDKNKSWIKKSSRSFSYTLPIPEQADQDQDPQATYDQGVLKLNFKKSKKSNGKSIRVEGKNKKNSE